MVLCVCCHRKCTQPSASPLGCGLCFTDLGVETLSKALQPTCTRAPMLASKLMLPPSHSASSELLLKKSLLFVLQKVDAILFVHITVLAASTGLTTTAWAQHRPVSHKALAAKAQMQPKCLSQRPIVTLSHHIMKVFGFLSLKRIH